MIAASSISRLACALTISPTPITAALAGIFSAVAWPLLWSRFVVPESAGTIAAVFITLLVIALPAHAFVVGFRPSQKQGARAVDTALLVRIGAWVLAAAVSVLIAAAIRS